MLNGGQVTWGADIDWHQDYWGVKVTDGGTPGTPVVLVDGDNVQVKVGMDDLLDAWPDGASQTVEPRLTTGPQFPFTIAHGRFLQQGQPVFLNILGYQPLEPGQENTGAIRSERVLDDLRRLEAYQGGGDPVALRVYAQPTPEYPIRMPKEFYDGARELGFWIIRDIYFGGYQGAGAVADGKAAIDAVIAEVESVGGLDRIFAWEIGNEFMADTALEIAQLEDFLGQMRDHIKMRMNEPGRIGNSDWVTWATFPPSDLLHTDGNPIRVEFDFYSINAYSYDPERIRDHQAGPKTGTPYAGYVQALAEEAQRQFPDKPVVISETGLPDSPTPVSDGIQQRLPPWYPNYRKGGLKSQQVSEGLVGQYMAVRLPGVVDGLAYFEWNDEWWKAGDSNAQDHPEEYFGLGRFDEVSGPGDYQLRYKLQQEAVRDLFTLNFYPESAILADLVADDASLTVDQSTTIRATVAADAPGPVRFRWESDRGRIVGDSDTVEFYVGEVALGPAEVTVVAIDGQGNAETASLTIDVAAPAAGQLEVLTLGGGRVAGRVANVDMDQYKVVVYVETDQQYPQPFNDAPYIYVGPDGYWWSEVHLGAGGELIAWVVPRDFDPVLRPAGSLPPAGTLDEDRTSSVNDTDGDLLDDGWETTHFAGLGQDRYGDPDGDLASNLDEFLANQAAQFIGGGNPAIADNDADEDDLADNWEYLFLRTLSFNADDDPDADGINNGREFTDLANDPADPGLGTDPGRTAPDRDLDQLPDLWEIRFFGSLAANPAADPNGDGVENLDAYELGISPVLTHSFFHAEGRGLVADGTGQKTTFRGVNLTGLDYGAFFDFPYPGVEGEDYSKPWTKELFAVAEAGQSVVRLPLEWARLVPGWSPGDPLPASLDPDELTMIDDVVNKAGRQGLYVILDMHDFLKYWSGQSAQVCVNESQNHQEMLAETWQLLAAHYAANPVVLGYDLMNEPVRYEPPEETCGSSNWHEIAQDVVDAIRTVDENHLIFVEGPNYSLANHWPVDNPAPFIVDSVTPPRIVYSPHVYFDHDNDSEYDQAGEDTGPVGGWQYYVRDRLMPAIDWSADYDVPIFLGELGVPCTSQWAGLLDHAFEQLLDPAEVSTAAWQYIDTERWSALPAPELNLAGCSEVLGVLADHAGGTYDERADFFPLHFDSLIYGDAMVDPLGVPLAEPWQDGSWGDVTVDFYATDQVLSGDYAISVQLDGAWDGFKSYHPYGLNTSRFRALSFWVYPTSADLNFRVFTTGPLPASAEYPAVYNDRPRLSDYLGGPPVLGQWQQVEIPLDDIVDPAQPAITGIAFQNDDQPDDPFYLDEISLLNPDLGVVDFAQHDSLDPAARDLWYSLQTAREGLLSLEASSPGSSLDTLLTLYDSGGTALMGSTLVDNKQRIDWPADGAGQTYYFLLAGTAENVDLRVANLVQQSGSAVTVHGTDGADQFTFAPVGSHRVTIDGLVYDFDEAEAATVSFDGGSGADTATLTGSDARDVATVYQNSGTMRGPGYRVELAGVESITLNGGGGNDAAHLHGSTGQDKFNGAPTSSTLYNGQFIVRANGFPTVHAHSEGGDDSAHLHGSAGNELFIGRPDQSKLLSDQFYARALGFRWVHAHSGGGVDTAHLFDSAETDTFIGRPTQSKLFDKNSNAFYTRALGFRYVHAHSEDADDSAHLFDSAQADTFIGRPTQSKLFNSTFYVRALDFRYVHGRFSSGDDVAHLFDSSGNDTLRATETYAKLYNETFYTRALDFHKVYARSLKGGDDTAYLFGSTMADQLTGEDNWAQLTNATDSLFHRVEGFDLVIPHAWPPGYDQSQDGGDTESIDEEAIDYILQLVGVWHEQ